MTPMKETLIIAVALLLAAQAGAAADSISVFSHNWTVPIKDDWKIIKEGGSETLELLVPRPSTKPRRPSQYALAQTEDFIKVTVEAEVKKEPLSARNRGTSLIFVYAWRDENHFNYVHLSVDTGKKQPVHNGVFHVYGGDRVRISSLDGPPALTSEDWHKVKLVYDGTAGRVDVFVDGVALPSLRAVDLSLGAGKVGIGSFFDMGQFKNVKITGEPHK
jgi:hypothetical protein